MVNFPGDVPEPVVLRTPEDADKILLREVMRLARRRPESPSEKIALLFSAMVTLTLKTLMYARRQHPHASDELLSESAAQALQLITASACCAACEAFDYDVDKIVEELAPLYEQYRNN
jgi:hypothetical protein